MLWPWDDLIIWSERTYRKTAKTRYFQLFLVDLTLPWPLDDIPRSWQCQNITSVCYLIRFCYISQCWHKGDLKGVWKPLQPLCYLCNPRGWFGVGLCWDLGMFQTIISISSKQNVSKNNKNKLFPTVLSRFDLAVSSKLPYQDLGITPLWYQTPTDVTCVLGLGFDRVIWSAGPTIYSQPFWADLTLLWPWDDLTKTSG